MLTGIVAILFVGVLGVQAGPGRQDDVKAAVDLSTVTSQMFEKDVNKVTGITLNIQGKASGTSGDDNAPNNLFGTLSDSQLQGDSIQALIALQDNYNPDEKVTETYTQEDIDEQNAFLDIVVASDVLDVAYNYLSENGYVSSKSELRSKMYTLWFGLYKRDKTTNSSSGFEHVFRGEFESSSTASGLHNWLTYYLQEQSGDLNYLGYYSDTPIDQATLIGESHSVDKRFKKESSFLVGLSPELEISIYTLCFLVNPNKQSTTALGGVTVKVQTWDLTDNDNTYIGATYFVG